MKITMNKRLYFGGAEVNRQGKFEAYVRDYKPQAAQLKSTGEWIGFLLEGRTTLGHATEEAALADVNVQLRGCGFRDNLAEAEADALAAEARGQAA
jgi:hypothetical protein